jgi:Tfp pilus assembly protein PilN
MEQQSTNAALPTLESNIDQLLQELHHLAIRVKQPDQHQQRDDSQSGQGQFLIASGRS